MSLFAPLVISLFFVSGFAVAGISAPDCSTTWLWSFNSLGQNACTVAAYMMSTCYGGSFTVDALETGYHYSLNQGADLCLCNTIAYSLYSACDGCQGSGWISWSDWAYNCTETLPPSTFPNPIPAGTSLPQWTLLDVTLASGSTWNETIAVAVGDNPELGPGTILSPSGTSVSSSSLTGSSTIHSSTYPSSSQNFVLTSTTASLSHTVASSSSPTTSIHGPGGHSTHSSNTGAIAGGAVAGVIAIFIVAVVSFLYGRRRSLLRQPAPSTDDGQPGGYNPWPMSGQETITPSLPSPTISLLRPYNPDDPTTFPGYQGASNPAFIPAQAPFLPDNRHAYTVAAPPIPEVQG